MEGEEQFIQSMTYADVARALSRDFFRVFCVNTSTGVFVEFMPHESDERLDIRTRGEDFSLEARKLVESAYGEDLDMVRTAFTKDNVLRVLSVDDSFILNYRMLVNQTPTYVKLKAVRVRAQDETHLLLALSDTDAHMQRLAKYERAEQNSLTYASVAEALSVDYACIFYVDMESGAYTMYKASEAFLKLGFREEERDFFKACQGEFGEQVYAQDRETFQKAMDKETLLRVLSADRIFLLTFRVLLEGHLTYIRIKVTRMLEGDDHHLVVGLSNVDASMQRSMEYQKMKEIANRDSMTGVKNKHSYSVTEEGLNLEISQGNSPVFGLAVCDVNGLKKINDTLGHKAGDEYIKKACQLICEVYKHSPVYRVGGDEFAVLLRGRDFENRQGLLDLINRQVEENKEKGEVVVSVGVAVFDPERDKDVASVFERADERMYVRKAALKGLRMD